MMYVDHHCDKDDIDNEEIQRRSTTISTCDKDFKWYYDNYLNFKHFKDITENKTGMALRVIDILRQSSSGNNSAKQALFLWHIDSKTDRLDNRISVIFLLSSTNSSMQMGPKDKSYLEFIYRK